ncbi:MAG: GNAT family N-acetyltransferase [Bacilli bacterium]|nr:GNAT family N-acetyltransferase [Bacilli bacterium]
MHILVVNKDEITEKEIDYLKDTECNFNTWLAKKIDDDEVESYLGDDPYFLFLCSDEGDIIGNCTLTFQDCIQDTSLYPWIGFVFIKENYRGHRYCGHLLDYACSLANEKYKTNRVYLATDARNLYEKFGFEYMENRIDFWGEDTRIMYKDFVMEEK